MVKRKLNLSKELGKKSSAFLFGARGVGKTRLARKFLSALKQHNLPTITFDLLKSEIYEKYLKQPHLFRLEVEELLKEKETLFVLVDEIQKIPQLLDEVHYLIESYKNQIRFLLTGSSARKLKVAGTNMLAGRALTLRLHPLSSEEISINIQQQLRLGSLPGVIFDNEAPENTLRSYVSTYLKEEIQQEALVRKISAFARFLEVAAQYHCEPINASAIGKAAGVSSDTIAQYFQILEDTLIGWKLPGWSASVKKQLRTTPKFYFFDNGVVNALRGELKVTLIESSARFGKLFEAWVIQEVFRCNDYHALDLKFSYWRTNSDVEVDLIVSRGAGQPLAAIEIKSGLTPENKDISGLRSFADEYPSVPRFCFCRAELAFSKDGVRYMPWQQGLHALKEI